MSDFLSSWHLFHNAYLSGLLLGVVLSLTGVVLVGKNQIFAGLAVSQGAALGIALCIWAGLHSAFLHDDLLLMSAGIGASLLVTVTLSLSRSRVAGDAQVGTLYLFCSGAALVLLSDSPLGLEEVHRLFTSTIIGATEQDVIVLSLLLVLSVTLLCACYGSLAVFVLDPELGIAHGVPLRRIGFSFALYLAVVLGFAIHISGTLFAFAALILPALAARYLAGTFRGVFVISPIVFTCCCFAGYLVAYRWDCPPGQAVVFVLSSLTLACAGFARLRQRRPLKN